MDTNDAMKVLDLEPEQFSFGIYRNLLVAVWSAQGTAPAVARLDAVAKQVSRACPYGFSAVHLIPDGVSLPDAEARTAFRQMLQVYAAELACVAVVVGGDGFWASAFRAMVTSIWQGTHHQFDMRICGNAAEVVEWLPPRNEKRTGVTLDLTTLRGMLSVARSLPSSRPPPERRA